MAARSQKDIWPLLGQITAPTMILHREEERGFSLDAAQLLVEAVPDATIHVLRAVGPATTFWDVRDGIAPLLRFLDAEPETAHVGSPATPSGGFRAILFTDVVSSTPLLTQLKDEKMRDVMRNHDEVLEAAVTSHGGRVIKTIGDAFMAEFAVPSGAVDAAIAALRGVREKFAGSDVPVRIRIGINAGEPIEEHGDLHGASVVIAKRLESEADANGILISDVVKQAVAGKDFVFDGQRRSRAQGVRRAGPRLGRALGVAAGRRPL